MVVLKILCRKDHFLLALVGFIVLAQGVFILAETDTHIHGVLLIMCGLLTILRGVLKGNCKSS